MEEIKLKKCGQNGIDYFWQRNCNKLNIMNKKNTKKTSKSIKSKKETTLDLELQESKDKYLRLYSEFENYRRRTSKEKVEMIDSANQDLLKDILPITDDFERAINSIKNQKLNDYEGFNLIFQKLNNILEKYNLKKMGTKKGDNFDSELHEAITSTPSEKKLKGKIVDIIEDGYLIGDKILRFAKVVIGL